jgi:N-acetylmuramic acid 6-phosphate etherase
MVRLGKVHGNLMVDLRAVNNKLRDRSARIVMELTHLPRRRAESLLRRAEGKVKAAIVMHYRKVNLARALRILDGCDQSLRQAIEDQI